MSTVDKIAASNAAARSSLTAALIKLGKLAQQPRK